MKVEAHLENLQESVREIEQAVQEGLLQKQRSLGFHASAGAVDMLEIILHEHKLIDPGFVIKHEWFHSSRKIAEKFPFDFPRKKEVLTLVAQIESVRNFFCYGKRQSEGSLEKVVHSFNALKIIFQEVTGHAL